MYDNSEITIPATAARGARYRNTLLSQLGDEDANLLEAHLEPVQLFEGEVLEHQNREIERVIFIERGIAAMVRPQQRRCLIGMIGPEGATGSSHAECDDRTPFTTVVQLSGDGYAMDAEDFIRLCQQSGRLRRAMLRYCRAFSIQISSTALSSVCPNIVRVSRWLLMTADRTEGSSLRVTHDLIAEMLDIRRPGVTEALHILEGERLLRATRGHIQIIDRDGLADRCGGSYGLAEAEYVRLVA